MSEIIPPLLCQYDGEGLVPPSTRWGKVWTTHLVVGQEYLMVESHDRSVNSHNHYFAVLHELWSNLPEQYADVPWAQTSEHLRLYALIKTGHCDTNTIVAWSKSEALSMAAFITPIDPYSIVSVTDCTVTRYTARSQSVKAMGKADFQKSKTDVLEFIEDLLGLSKDRDNDH